MFVKKGKCRVLVKLASGPPTWGKKEGVGWFGARDRGKTSGGKAV